jgi:hypothetical protein
MRLKYSNEVRLSGRFGNQVFQLCAAIFLAKKDNRPVKLNARGTRPRDLILLLDSGLVMRSELSLTLIQKFYFNFLGAGKFVDYAIALKLLVKYRLERAGIPPRALNLLTRRTTFLADEDWKLLPAQVSPFYGYFQDSALVDEVWRELRKRFFESKLYESKVLKHDKVVIHIRLTDYLLHPEIGSLTEDYYLRCLERLPKKEICIVTDDVFEFQKQFPILARKSTVFEKTYDAQASFEFMCRAKFLVIANSSFSYWAGIFALMSDESSMVISPAVWRSDGTQQCIIHKKFILEQR